MAFFSFYWKLTPLKKAILTYILKVKLYYTKQQHKKNTTKTNQSLPHTKRKPLKIQRFYWTLVVYFKNDMLKI